MKQWLNALIVISLVFVVGQPISWAGPSDALSPSDQAVATYRQDGVIAREAVPLHGRYVVTHHDLLGAVQWVEHPGNLITSTCRNYVLDTAFSGAAATTPWYLGLKNTGVAVSADTSASHASWTEYTNYSEAVRQTWAEAGVASQKITNAASPAAVTISGGGGTVAGVFLISNSTKGGTTGTLCSVADFSVARVVTTGTLTMTYEITD